MPLRNGLGITLNRTFLNGPPVGRIHMKPAHDLLRIFIGPLTQQNRKICRKFLLRLVFPLLENQNSIHSDLFLNTFVRMIPIGAILGDAKLVKVRFTGFHFLRREIRNAVHFIG